VNINFPADLIEALRSSGHIAVLTGAGVSQESGLRTFRDPQEGLWSQYNPQELASPEAFRQNPKLVWDWYAWRREAIKGVRPNPGHYALVEMSRKVLHFTLITQNVDGLHRMAGGPKPIELHGNINQVRCSECGQAADEWDDNGLEAPRCRICNGLLRPNVVWFGEPLPHQELEAALKAARACDTFFSIGTSAEVQPAASLAYEAQNHGAMVIEINTGATLLSPRVDFMLKGKSGEILPALVNAAWEKK
jgi:NAD-dependent protein deacetylase/lipoamidase